MSQFADYYSHDMSLQVGAMQYMRPARWPPAAAATTVASHRTWSGRIEKPRSQHNSPASSQMMRRGYPMTRTPSQYNFIHSQPMYAQRRPARPYSWGPLAASSTTLPTNDYVISPATSSQGNPMAAYSFHTSTPCHYQGIQATSNAPRAYDELSQYRRAAMRTASIDSSSSCYSSQSTSPASPLWHQQKPEQNMPALASATSSIYDSPELTTSWQFTPQHHSQQAHPNQTTSYSPCTPLASAKPAPAVLNNHNNSTATVDIPFAFTYDHLLDSPPPQSDLLWSTKSTADDGEVLVALGLYDAPDAFDSPTAAPRKLKLAETWQLPAPVSSGKSAQRESASKAAENAAGSTTEDASDEEEALDEDISFPKVADGTSWFLP